MHFLNIVISSRQQVVCYVAKQSAAWDLLLGGPGEKQIPSRKSCEGMTVCL